MVTLAEATPEADTPVGLLRKGRVRLPDGAELDTRHASARSVERAAKQLRHAAAAGKPRRGRTTTAEERALASKPEAALHRAALERAVVTALATKPGRASELRLEHIHIDRLAALEKALARVEGR